MLQPVSKLFGRKIPWMASSYKNQDVILRSQVSVSRNLRGHVFPGWATPDQTRAVLDLLLPYLGGLKTFDKGYGSKIADLSDMEKQLLVERGVLDSAITARREGAGFVLSPNQDLCAWINGDEHLRLISTQPGLNLQKAWKLVNEFDHQMANELPYAHHPQLGYLSADPYLTGSGLEVSVLVNVPGLLLSGNLDETRRAMEALNFGFEGISGEEEDDRTHSLYLITSQASLGSQPEDEVVKQLTRIVTSLQKQELNLRTKILTENRLGVTDLVCKALAILKYARLMSMHDVIDKLFIVRLGISLGIIPSSDVKDINRVFLEARAGHLSCKFSFDDQKVSRDTFLARVRADYLRDFFSHMSDPIC